MSKAHGPLADRPINPKVGLEISHESAPLHVTGAALYTEDLLSRMKDPLHAWPLQAPHAHARITRLDVDPAYAVPGVVKVLTADDVPGLNDAGEKHDEPLFPDEVMFYGHAVCWVLGETPDTARRGAEAIEVDYEPLPSLVSIRDAIKAESFQGHQRTISRGDADTALRGGEVPVRGGVRVRRPGALLPGMQRGVGPGGRERSGVRAVQHPAPDRDPGHRRPRARRSRTPSDRAVPADGRRLRRQGVPAARPGCGRSAGRDTHRTPGQPRPEPDPGHHHDRQAASVPGGVGGRVRPGSADLRAAGDADQQRRLEPRPVRAGAGPRAVPHRQRLLHPAHPRRPAGSPRPTGSPTRRSGASAVRRA